MKTPRAIKAFPSLDVRNIFNRRASDDPVLGRDGIRFYASGRAALFHAVKSLGLPKGSVVLLPSFHCGVEVEAVLRAGSRVDFYKIDRNLGVDHRSVLEKCDASTKGIVIAHFFGFPQELSNLRDLCRERGICLIEDCAHALYSRGRSGVWLGTEGDLGVFSMRKTVFLPDGGAVLANGKGVPMPGNGESHFNLVPFKASVRSVFEHESNGAGLVAKLSRRILDWHETRKSVEEIPGNPLWYYEVPHLDYRRAISGLSSFLAGRERYDDIIERRRINYAALEQLLKPRLSDDFVFPELPDGTCPLCFPLFTRERDTVAARMVERGVEPFVFGRFSHPLHPTAEFPEASLLANGILGLPVHQQMTPEDMVAVADVLNEAQGR